MVLQPQLSWEATTDPDGDVINYNLYISTENPPTNKMASDLTTTYYNIQDSLDFEATYYWKVIAKDNQGNTTESSVASFKTRSQTVEELLVGKWFFESIEGNPPITECQKQGFYQFLENGTFLGMGFDVDNNGDCISNSSSTGTYLIINNNQIEVITNGQNNTLQIITLTNEQLVVGSIGIIITLKKE